jgi:hypothetical protein
MSSGVVGKKWSTYFIDFTRKNNFCKICSLGEIGVPLPNIIFKQSENGSVLQNGVKHVRKYYF